MDQSTITFVINGQTFSLRADDMQAIAAIPAAERQQLLVLLEGVKQQEDQAAAVARQALDRANTASSGAPGSPRVEHPQPSPERLGSGDVDAFMARLVMEENRNKKAVPSKQTIARWLLGLAAAAILLILFF